jgi:hypothetical protein
LNNIDLDCLSDLIVNTIQPTPEQCAVGIKHLGKMFYEFNKLTDCEKAQFWIDAFKNPDNKDACEAFANRHPNCSFNSIIPK